MTPPVTLTVDKAKAALREILAAVSLPENAAKISEAKSNAGNDMLCHMHLVFPLITRIEQEVLKNYGFAADSQGVVEFTQMVKALEKESEEISQLNNALRTHLIPLMKLPNFETDD